MALYFAAGPFITSNITRILIGWDGGVIVFLLLAMHFMKSCDHAVMKRLDIEQGAERALNLLRAMTLEIQMLARACGKSDVHHLEPEDMAALTMEASIICGVPLAGTRKVFGR